MRFVCTVKAFGQERVFRVEAESFDHASDLAWKSCNLSVKIEKETDPQEQLERALCDSGA